MGNLQVVHEQGSYDAQEAAWSPAHAPSESRATKGVYGISVAAELVGMTAQRLRWYESQDLLEPERTAGGTRRYSDRDLQRLQRIDELLEAGLNVAGISMVLRLQDENDQLHERLTPRQSDTPQD